MSAHRVGPYRVHEPLGSGGEGEVYRATRRLGPGEEQVVALKLGRVGAAGLRREAHLTSLLRHPHLVDVLEVGQEGAVGYCAMEWCQGGDLGRYLPLPPRAVVDVGLQVCDALAYAHDELGLVHLDLKPANLLVDGGVIKVADLGIAQARGFVEHTRRGTPPYLAPEQGRGDDVDARTDVYALGVTLAELARGAPSTASSTLDFSFDYEAEQPEDLPAWLQPVVDRCTALDPAERFSDMRALADALAALDVQGDSLRTVLGVPEPASAPSTPWIGRDEELTDLLRRLEQGVAVVSGPRGIGRARLARVALEGRPVLELDGARYGPESGRVELAAVVGSPTAESSQLAARLAGSAVLVRDADEPEAWAQAAAAWSVPVVITTVRPMTNALRLGPLAPDDARALFLAVARRRGVKPDPDAALESLLEQLDGMPLALELAAGRLGVLSVAEVAERLTASFLRGRDSSLGASLRFGWEGLEPHEQELLTTIAAYEGGAASRALSPGLDALLERAWVSLDEGRSRVLRPVRLFVQETVEPEVWERALRARDTCVLHEVSVLLPQLDTHAGIEARRQLEPQVDDLRAALQRALAAGDLCAVPLFEALMRLRGSGPLEGVEAFVAPVLSLELDADQRARLVAWAALLDHRRGDFDRARERLASVAALPVVLEQQAEVARVQGELDAAAVAWERVLEHEQASVVDRVRARAGLGLVAYHRGAYERGLEHFRRGLVEARRRGLRENEARLLQGMASLLRSRGAFDVAERRYREAYAAFKDVRDVRGQLVVAANLGTLFMDHDQPREAYAAYSDALEAVQKLGDPRIEATIRSNRGRASLWMGDVAAAREAIRGALETLRALGVRRSVLFSTLQLAEVEQAEGDLRAAEARFLEVTRDPLDERVLHAVAWSNIGELRASQGRPFDDAFLAALERLDGTHPPEEGRTERVYAAALAQVGRTDEALQRCDRALELLSEGVERDRAEALRAELAG